MIAVRIDLVQPVNLDFQSFKVLEVGNEFDFEYLFDLILIKRFNNK